MRLHIKETQCVHHPMKEQEISRFVEDANNGFEQKSPYALHCLAACVGLIVLVEQFRTRSRTQSNTLLLFLAIVIAQGLARTLSVQVSCSLFPPWLCEYGSAVADATHMYQWIMNLVLIQTVCSFMWSLCSFLWSKDTTIDWGVVGRRVLQCGCDICSSLDRPPTYSMWLEMSVLTLLVFLACVFYENVFHLLYQTAIRFRFVWLFFHWLVVPAMINCTHGNTKWCGENLKKCMTVLADVLSTMATPSTTPAPILGAPAAPAAPPAPGAPGASAAPGAPPAPTAPLDGAELLKKSKKELQAMLAAKGLPQHAQNKTVLVNRILAAPP